MVSTQILDNNGIKVWIAVVILSVFFSLLHDNHIASGAIGWHAFTDRFLMGLGASALTIKYHSLRPAVVMHATFNAIGGTHRQDQMRIEHNGMQNRSTETAPKRATILGDANTPALSEPPGA
jgi:Type II CAAX prenyl endopeptidase Rce1-like